MSIFKKAKTQGIEEAKDTLGGGHRVLDTDVYTGDIIVAYVTPTKKGGVNVNIEVKLTDGTNYRETLFVMNEKNEVYFERDGKKVPYAGYTRINDICMLTLEKELSEVDTDNKVLSLYDFESRKEVPREVPVLTDLTGQTITLAIQQIRSNKQMLDDDGKYQDTPEERLTNAIVGVFHPTEGFTVTEGTKGLEPTFQDKWLEKNKGVTYDRYKEVSQRRGSARSASTADAPARKSMFGKK